jgi:nitrate/nitrite transporter NarK
MGNEGIRVAWACAGLNLALGAVYSWHIAKGELLRVLAAEGPAHWSSGALDDLFGVTCLVFAVSMVFAGRLQDEIGPRATAFIGGVLVACGFMLVALAKVFLAWFIGFGVIAGVGMGMVYASTTPTALRWFPRAKSGLVSGLVVAGYGLGALYVTPLMVWLIGSHGVQQAMMILGTSFLVVVALLSQLLAIPVIRPTLFGAASEDDRGLARLLRSSTLWLLWITFFAGAGAGLMVGDFLSELARASLGSATYAALVVMALGGTTGRIGVGAISDRWGRPRTLTTLLGAQAVLMLIAGVVAGGKPLPAVAVLALIGGIAFNFGGNLSLFPAFVRDRYGLQDFGRNYGVVFTAWGVGGFALSRIAEALYGATGSHRPACLLACMILVAGCLISRRLWARQVPTVATGVVPAAPAS